jgi:hypothetical protein
MEVAAELEYTVRSEPVPGSAEGCCNPREKVIVLDDALPANGRVHVLVHEIAHAMGIGYDQHTRARAETLVESITDIVCRGIGLNTGGASVPYARRLGRRGPRPLREFAGTVDEIARRVEAALHPNDPKEHDQ